MGSKNYTHTEAILIIDLHVYCRESKCTSQERLGQRPGHAGVKNNYQYADKYNA